MKEVFFTQCYFVKTPKFDILKTVNMSFLRRLASLELWRSGQESSVETYYLATGYPHTRV